MALSRRMWFGTKDFSRWIKTHSPSSDYTKAGYNERLDYLNGGVGMRGSVNGHTEVTITWSRLTSQQAREITDYAYGVFGDGPIYWLDPVSMEQNVLNKAWSQPAITGKDAQPLAGTVRPELVANGDQSYGYPTQMAKYTLTATDDRSSFYLPVPPGFTAWVGVHGDSTSTLGIEVQPTNRGLDVGWPTVVPVVGVNAPDRFSNSFDGGDQGGIRLTIQSASGFITVAGIIVQVLPTGVTPATGPYISGQGQGGLRFEGRVQPTPYSLAHDSFGLSVKLVEAVD